MITYIGWTLVDITNTNVTTGNTKERNQQRNWETVLQTLNLQTAPLTIEAPAAHSGKLEAFAFGAHYPGEHKVWAFRFTVKADGIFTSAQAGCNTLNNDFDNVPIILGLDETAKIPLPMFFLNPVTRNIYFEIDPSSNT